MGKNRHHLQDRLIDALVISGPRHKLVLDLGMVVLNAHQPEACWSPFTESYSRWECEGHLGSNEEQQTWPCDEIEALAGVLGVPL